MLSHTPQIDNEMKSVPHNTAGLTAFYQVAVAEEAKRETMEEFKARLRRVALSVSENKVKKAVGSMVRRCATISAAAGDLFTE